jgi:formylglycine-generating enzyme required for sulfatase activity
MTKKTPIKVIKREERTRQQSASEQPQNVKKTAQETARDMVGTVTNWVNEFQQKRRTETSRALQNIQNLFPEPATQPNEA